MAVGSKIIYPLAGLGQAITRVATATSNKGEIVYGGVWDYGEETRSCPAGSETYIGTVYGPYIKPGQAFIGFIHCRGWVPQSVLRTYVNRQLVLQQSIENWDSFFLTGRVEPTGGTTWSDVEFTITPTSNTVLVCRAGYAYGKVLSQGAATFDLPITGCKGEIECSSTVAVFPLASILFGYSPFTVTIEVDGSDKEVGIFSELTFENYSGQFTWRSKSPHVDKLLLLRSRALMRFNVPDGVVVLLGYDEGSGYSTILACSSAEELEKNAPDYFGYYYSENATYILIAHPGPKEIKGCVTV